MVPELFRFYDVGFPSYFVLYFSGFVYGTALALFWARRVGLDPDPIVSLGFWMLLAGLAGARLLHVIADGHFVDYVHLCTAPERVTWPFDEAQCLASGDGAWDAARRVCHPRARDCFAWARFWSGGLTYYGGFFAVLAASSVFLRRHRFPFWKATDMAGFVIPVGLAFGRMGCFLGGCCYGSLSTLPWAVAYPPNSAASKAHAVAGWIASPQAPSLPTHPTQLYEAAAALVIGAFALFVVLPRKRYDGQVFAVFLVLYAVARFAIEAVRGDERGGAAGLSTSQLIGLGLVAAAAVIHAVRRPRAMANGGPPS